MQEALDLVCRKRKLDPRNYALVLNDNGSSILIPLDRTVASLQGKRELLLVKRDNLPEMGIEAEKRAIRTTDPNGKFPLLRFGGYLTIITTASIFKRMSDVPEVQISAAMDYTAAYKVMDPLILNSCSFSPLL
jgi:target of rapamycin complex 2 subunit MAPKAP1